MKIGVCGTGKMGGAIAHRLLTVGHDVAVWNRNPAKAKPLVDVGATAAASPAALASTCDTVISMVLDDAAVTEIYTGRDGLLSGDVAGKLFIEMSTVLPETQKKLGALVTEKGAAYVDCPVGGTVGPARDGKLLGVAGGAAGDFERAKPILDQLCRRLEHVGSVGAGATFKLAVNLPLLVYWQSLGEALALVAPLGLPPERVMEILADTSGANNAVKQRGGDIAAALGGAAASGAAFDLGGARKDLATMVGFGKALGRDLPVTQAALSAFDDAVQAGLGGADATRVAVHFASKAG